ncbi:MAG TPA: hypothetical protein VF746_31895 [Longimicrobium sp.]|jgi:hypothetical protein
MSERWRTIAGAVAFAGAALLVGCGGAAAQSGTWRSSHTDHGRRVDIEVRGEVDFTEDDRDVARLSSDGRISIEEAVAGRPDRRVEFRPDARGGVQRLYYEDGVQRTPDADDRAWIEQMVLGVVRRSGLGSEHRVARLRARNGVDGVLREIDQLEGDGGKRQYYAALLRSPGLRADETARILRHAGRVIDSDSEKRYVLARALERASLGPAEMAALLEAAATIRSDSEKRYVLARALELGPGPAELAALLDVAAGISSDGERTYVLVRVARADPLADARVRRAFFHQAEGISSDSELARLLLTVLRRDGARDDAVAAAVRASEHISSDGERARVLVSVPERSLRSEAVRDAFERAMDGIGSGGERARVARWFARAAT